MKKTYFNKKKKVYSQSFHKSKRKCWKYFVEILLWFNVISNRFVLLKRQVFLFIYTYTKYNRFVISFEANSKDERIYISQSARGQLSAWLESSSISFFCRRAENVLTSLENLSISSILFVPKNFDRFSPIKGNLSSNIYIYISLSKRGTILKSKRLIARNSKSFFGWRRRTSGVQFLPYLRSSSEQSLLWGEGYLRDFFSQESGRESKRAQRGISFTKGTRKSTSFLSLSPFIFSSKR